jgi:hypothetical protein
MTKIEINIDSTSLGRSGCILHFYRHVVAGYTHKALGASLLYGIGVHKFIDVMFQTNGLYPKAMEKALEMFRLPAVEDKKKEWLRNEIHFRAVCFNFWEQWIKEDPNFEVILKPNGKPATEVTFSFKFYEDDYVIINLCGTIDSIGKFKNGCYAIRDFKTTASWNQPDYWKQYEMSRQLRLYTLACKIMAQREPDSVLGKIGAQKMGAFIDGIFLDPKANDTKFARSVVYQYGDNDIKQFEQLLVGVCKRISYATKTQELPKEGLVNGNCESKWSDGEKGKCDFWNVCKSNIDVGNILLNRDFIRKPFNPLMYNQ